MVSLTGVSASDMSLNIDSDGSYVQWIVISPIAQDVFTQSGWDAAFESQIRQESQPLYQLLYVVGVATIYFQNLFFSKKCFYSFFLFSL